MVIFEKVTLTAWAVCMMLFFAWMVISLIWDNELVEKIGIAIAGYAGLVLAASLWVVCKLIWEG